MAKTVEFRPIIKAVKMNSGEKQEVVLTIDNGSLNGKFESLSQLIGEAVNVVIQPSMISYRIPFDRQTDEPQIKYVYDTKKGEVVEHREEQLSLENMEQNAYFKDFVIERDVVDQYILKAPLLTLPGHIELNPREILDLLQDEMTYEEIAEEMEVKEAAVVTSLEKARMHFAPYAAAWNQIKE